MPRARRIDLPDTDHHVVNRGVNRQTIFFDDRDRVRFGQILAETHERFGVTILAYCLMDNHYHLVVHCPDAVLSAAMQFVDSRYAEFVNWRHLRSGHLFGARFFSAAITSDAYMLACLRYVERNPLDLPRVSSPTHYRWSSARAHLGLRRAPDWLDSARVLDWFQTRDDFHRFIHRDPVDVEPERLDLDHAHTVASLMIDTHVDPEISSIQMERTVLLGLADRLGPDNRRRMFEHLDLSTTRSVREALRRARKRASDHPSVSDAVDATQRLLFDTVPDGRRTAA